MRAAAFIDVREEYAKHRGQNRCGQKPILQFVRVYRVASIPKAIGDTNVILAAARCILPFLAILPKRRAFRKRIQAGDNCGKDHKEIDR